jgi:hypothetical protein
VDQPGTQDLPGVVFLVTQATAAGLPAPEAALAGEVPVELGGLEMRASRAIDKAPAGVAVAGLQRMVGPATLETLARPVA